MVIKVGKDSCICSTFDQIKYVNEIKIKYDACAKTQDSLEAVYYHQKNIIEEGEKLLGYKNDQLAKKDSIFQLQTRISDVWEAQYKSEVKRNRGLRIGMGIGGGVAGVVIATIVGILVAK